MQSLMKARPAHVGIAAKRATQFAAENGCTLRAFAGLSRRWARRLSSSPAPRAGPYRACRRYRVGCSCNACALFTWFLLAPIPFGICRLLTVDKLLNHATNDN